MARVEVRLPAILRTYADGRSSVEVHAASVGAALAALEATHPAVGRRVRDEQGAIRRHVSVFHGDDLVRDLDAALVDGDTLTVVAAVSGG